MTLNVLIDDDSESLSKDLRALIWLELAKLEKRVAHLEELLREEGR